jgi:predicted enzyme related to lactoylglutathione lyase
MKKPHRIVRFEIGCEDTGKTQAFYAGVFDWKITPGGAGLAIDTGSEPSGGITSLGHEPRHYTMFYVETENVADSLADIERLGGKRLVGPVKLPTGTFAWFADPEGNTVGLWQPG